MESNTGGMIRAAAINEPHRPVTVVPYGDAEHGVTLVQIQEDPLYGGQQWSIINLTPQAMDAIAQAWLSWRASRGEKPDFLCAADGCRYVALEDSPYCRVHAAERAKAHDGEGEGE